MNNKRSEQTRATSPHTLFSKWLKSPEKKATDQRAFQFENLEERCVLSGNTLDFAIETPSESVLVADELPQHSPDVEANNIQTEITSVTIRLNGELQTLAPSGQTLALAAGDEFEVVHIALESNAADGVFAGEGYVNKIDSQSSASLIDYNDGRFSQIEDNFQANGGNGTVDGLDGSWAAQKGWDRLTISIIHYQESGTSVAARAQIQLDVGQAEFEFEPSAFENLQTQEGVVGETFNIFGAWKNVGTGNFHNYAEVDIYHSSNPEEIVWAGALVGNASNGNLVEGNFVNVNEGDSFSEFFVPQKSGSYTLRFYLDPEDFAAETNESDNRFDVQVRVNEPNSAPVANNDSVQSGANQKLDRIEALANDLDADQDSIAVNEFSQAENGTVELNEDGTFSYEPENGFTGVDEFTYTVTDGQDHSNVAVVQVEVQPPSFDVEPTASGDEDKPIDLKVEADPNQITHVRVSNVPNGALLSHGDQVSDRSYDVAVSDLAKLQITPTPNSDASFELAVTPFYESTAYVDLTETISVDVNAVADGGEVDVANFGIVTGSSGRLPFRFQFSDLDNSEQHTITFDGLPDFISLSAGQKIGDSWVLSYNDLTDLRIQSTTVDDLSGFRSSRGYYFKRFEVQVSVESVETSNQSNVESMEEFYFYAIQRS